MAGIDAVLFDVGNVLLEWDPRHLYRRIFRLTDAGSGQDNPGEDRPGEGEPDGEKVEWFLANICTTSWHIHHDLGRSSAAQTAELTARHPEWHAEIAAFHDRFQEMIPAPLPEIVAAKRQMRQAGLAVYGLTNFGASTFAATRQRFPFLGEFDGIIVSGEEGIMKPDPEIFRLAITRFALTAERTLFIDDAAPNIAAAAALGFRTHHFTGIPECLAALRELDLI